MIFYIHTINLLFALCGLGLLAVTAVLLWDYKANEQRLYTQYVAPYVWWLIMLVAWGGVGTTLLYSEVFGFIPCSLCWLQRVALYSQAFMSVFAWRAKDAIFFPLYGMVLSGFGFVVAIYQYIYQAIPDSVREGGLMPCLADGSADCSKTVMEVFGFVTFPFLSGVLFIFLIVLYLHMRRAQ
jgi:disulfide bond formation protein DsbB